VCTVSQGLAAIDIGSDLIVMVTGLPAAEAGNGFSLRDAGSIVSKLRQRANHDCRILLYEPAKPSARSRRSAMEFDGIVYGP
jgi:hypothetical protein